jgi:hypothetical protein
MSNGFGKAEYVPHGTDKVTSSVYHLGKFERKFLNIWFQVQGSVEGVGDSDLASVK